MDPSKYNSNESNGIVNVAWEATKKTIVCQTRQESQGRYDHWAEKYDNHYEALGYRTPEVASQLILEYVKNQEKTKILDVATGTGLFPFHLRNTAIYVGQIDIMDANMEMLRLAHNKNLSIRTLACYWLESDGELPFAPDAYDAVTCFGALLPNHMPANTIKAMLTVAKPGGFLLFNVRIGYYDVVVSYNEEILDIVDQLVKCGKVEVTERKEIYHLENIDDCKTVLYVCKKL